MTRRRRKGCRFRFFLLMLVCVVLVTGIYRFTMQPADYAVSDLMEMGYPESLARLYVRNEEAREFVLAYDSSKGSSDNIDVTKDVNQGEIPFFLQWDERWGYAYYGDDFMAVEGCGPTALSMVYCGLTGDSSMHPLAMAKLAEESGYYVHGSGSSWSMMADLALTLGLEVREVYFDRNSILNELLAGNPIICIVGPGDFTTSGHFIVLTDVDEEGYVTVHDPNSISNSKKKWDIDTIMSQTENLWGYRNSLSNTLP